MSYRQQTSVPMGVGPRPRTVSRSCPRLREPPAGSIRRSRFPLGYGGLVRHRLQVRTDTARPRIGPAYSGVRRQRFQAGRRQLMSCVVARARR